MKRWLWLAVLLLPCAMHAQVVGPGFINYVTSAPSGVCSQGEQMRVVIGLGTVYTCQSGTWTQVGGAGGGTVTSVSFTGGLISVATPTTTPAFTVAGISGGIPFFDSTSTWNSSALLASNSPVLGGGAGSTPKTAAFLTTNGTNELDVGVVGSGNAVLGLNGTTSGKCTQTTDATGTTVTQNCFNLFPNGAAATAGVALGIVNTGWFRSNASGSMFATIAGNITFAVVNGAGVAVGSGGLIGIASTASAGPGDTCFSRSGAGIFNFGNCSGITDTTTKLRASGYISVGTKFTTDTGCGTVTTLLGGATAGSFVANTTGACTVVITMGDTATAPNGWACTVNDRTTSNLFRQTASAATTCTISGTAVSGDVISFSATGY